VNNAAVSVWMTKKTLSADNAERHLGMLAQHHWLLTNVPPTESSSEFPGTTTCTYVGKIYQHLSATNNL